MSAALTRRTAAWLAVTGGSVYNGWSGPIEFDDGGTAQATWFGVQILDPTTGGITSERFVLGSP